MNSLKFFDIAINATDLQNRGIYRGRRKHADDFEHMQQRSMEAGCSHWLITGGDLEDSREALKMATTRTDWFSTAGIHPTRSNLVKEHKDGTTAYLQELKSVLEEGIVSGKVRALGECGLDYDRLDWSSKEDQIPVFRAQLELAVQVQLPLFLHSRACEEDFLRMLLPYTDKLPHRGVVHSFTGSMSEMKALTKHGWSIGINGCSLKTEENLSVVKEVPMHSLMLETDAPWCEIRPSHAGHRYLSEAEAPTLPESKKVEKFELGKMVRGRNEPCAIIQVAWIVARVKGIAYGEVARMAYDNSMRMFCRSST